MSRFSSVGRSSGPALHCAPARSQPPQSGLAFGTGSAMVHRVVDAVMVPRTVVSEAAAAPSPSAPPSGGVTEACSIQSKAFQDCLNSHGEDMSKCQFYFDMLTECLESRII